MIKTTTTKKATTRATTSLPRKSKASATSASTVTLKMKRINLMSKERKNRREIWKPLQIVMPLIKPKITVLVIALVMALRKTKLQLNLLSLIIADLTETKTMMADLAKTRTMMADLAERKLPSPSPSPSPSPLPSPASPLVIVLAVVKALKNLVAVEILVKNAHHYAPSTRFSPYWLPKHIGLLTMPSITNCHPLLPPDVWPPTLSHWLIQRVVKLSLAWVPLQRALFSSINLWCCQETYKRHTLSRSRPH